VVTDRGKSAIRNASPAKGKNSAHGRQILRSFAADHLEKGRGHHEAEAHEKANRKGQVWVEPRQAEAREWPGFRRLRTRGLPNPNIQGVLVASGQDPNRMLAATGRGWRQAFAGAW
jgi:hypothetical protein